MKERRFFGQFSVDLEVLKWILTHLFNEAGVAQLVEHHLAKVAVESSNLFARSTFSSSFEEEARSTH
ncbi:hypothetical protein VDG1235_2955 [Verrucomicrobiia bacterium DG1235]|nr:hypothetical protein VDG1235_2955 [Verrucomicrobiae bacterium DG1235]